MELLLVIVGLAFQVFGVWATIYGSRIAWDAVADDDDHFWAPATTARRELCRVLRIGDRSVKIQTKSDPVLSFLDGTSIASRAYDPIDQTRGLQDQIAELDRRLREMDGDQLGRQRSSVDRQTLEEHNQRKVAAAEEQRRDVDRRQAVRGIRIEAWGFIWMTIGAASLGVASIISALS